MVSTFVERVAVAGAIGCFVFGSIGCKPKPKEFKRYNWVDNKLGGPDSPVKCTAELKGTMMVLDCEALPPGSTISLRGVDHPAAGTFHQEIDIGDLLGDVTTKDATGYGFKLDPKIPMVLTTPAGFYKTTVPGPPYLHLGLQAGVGKPMLFGGETATASTNPNPSVWFLGMNSELYGPAATLKEIDWLAVEGSDPVSVKGPMCRYQNTKTGAVTSEPLAVLANEAVIYDRRTGKIVDRKPFYANPTCPTEKPVGDPAVTAPSEEMMKFWVKGRRTSKK